MWLGIKVDVGLPRVWEGNESASRSYTFQEAGDIIFSLLSFGTGITKRSLSESFNINVPIVNQII